MKELKIPVEIAKFLLENDFGEIELTDIDACSTIEHPTLPSCLLIDNATCIEGDAILEWEIANSFYKIYLNNELLATIPV